MDPERSKKSEISADLPKASRTSYGMDKSEVLRLANLARVKLTEAEAEKLSGEFEAILGYVGEVKEIASSGERIPKKGNFVLKNIMREDGDGHESGLYTDKLLKEAPYTENGFVKVKQILS